MTLYYLGSPYSKYPNGINAAFRDVAQLAARLLMKGYIVYSPIAHTHPIAIYGGINPLDHKIWLPFDQKMIVVCDAMIVARMDGWKDSFGIGEEIKMFEAAGKPIYDVDPATLEIIAREKNK
jgi:hypothetical protein